MHFDISQGLMLSKLGLHTFLFCPASARVTYWFLTVQIAMGTFIVSFIGNSFVASAASLPQLNTLSPQRRRRVLVLVYYTFIILLFTLFGVLIIPDVVREGYDFVSRLQTENLWVVVLEKMRKGLGYDLKVVCRTCTFTIKNSILYHQILNAVTV